MLFWKKKRQSGQAEASPSAKHQHLLGKLEASRSELVRVVGPEDEGCVCGDWVGAVLSVSGADTRVPSVSDAVGDGLFHPGCRHYLAAFDPAKLSSEPRAEAWALTQRAMAAMERRKAGLSSSDSYREEQLAQPISVREKFERVYRAALDADRARDHAATLIKCRAALELLADEDIFGSRQHRVENMLRARIRRLEQQRRDG